MIQEGLRTIDIIEREQQRGPEHSENIVDFLRMLAQGRYKSVTILGISEMYFALCAVHMGVEKITWYSENDALDFYMRSEKHNRVIGDVNKVFIEPTDFLVVSMNQPMQSAYPDRWLKRHLVRANKRVLVTNSLVAFDKNGDSVASKEVFANVVKENKNIFVLDRQQTRSFGWSELKNKLAK